LDLIEGRFLQILEIVIHQETGATLGCILLPQRRNGLFQNRLECRFIGYRKVSQYLAIDFNFGCGQTFHKAAVGGAKLAASRVDSLDPEIPKIALPRLSVTVRPILSLHRGIFGVTEKL
jgi:hypothetical protein